MVLVGAGSAGCVDLGWTLLITVWLRDGLRCASLPGSVWSATGSASCETAIRGGFGGADEPGGRI